MAGKEMRAQISLAGKVDPSLKKSIDQVNRQLKQMGDMKGLSGAVKNLGSAALDAGKKLGGALVTGITAAASAAGAAAVAIGGAALQSYASYEQMVGGVETLFGTGGRNLEEYAAYVGKSVDEAKGEYDALMASQQNVMNNAAAAYKTAGVSANSYMEQATMMSASLISSLGGDTQQAADLVNMAIGDMSDRPLHSIVRLKRVEPCQGCVIIFDHANGETLKAA